MNTPSLHDELAGICAAMQIHSPAAFSFRSELPYRVNASLPGDGGHAALLEALRNVLYATCYTRPSAAGETQPANLVPQLSQANRSRDRWDGGWVIYQLGADGRISAQKGERSRWAVVGEYATGKAPGMPPRVGDTVHMRVCPGSADVQAGFYFSFGETLSDQFDEHALLRYYFNIRAAGAAALLSAVSAQFNHYAIPYRYKTLSDAASYVRADAAVLYVAKRYHSIAAALLKALGDPLGAWLRPETPMFCKTLRPGVGIAEEPGTGESFGMHRCRLVAEGIVDAWTMGTQSVAARLEAVEKRFSASGISLERPYLNARSVDFCAADGFAGGIAA